MFDDLLLHTTTRMALDAFATRPPHALLLVGPAGIGKFTVAIAWARHLLQDAQYAPQVITPDEKGSISIETIRGLYRAVRGKRTEQQVIVIDHAEAMSVEAENAFLKLLEEPRQGVTFVLTAPHMTAVLPTILSRAQRVELQPLDATTMQAFVSKQRQLSSADLAQLLFIAEGRPATAVQLLNDETRLNEHRSYMQRAKELLTAKPYTRYITISTLNADRSACFATLTAMLQMVELQLKKNTNPTQVKGLLIMSENLQETLSLLEKNGNIKAQLLKLFASY